MIKLPQCPISVLRVSDCGVAIDRLVPGAKSAPDPEKGQLQPEGQAMAAEELGQYMGMCKTMGHSPARITLFGTLNFNQTFLYEISSGTCTLTCKTYELIPVYTEWSFFKLKIYEISHRIISLSDNIVHIMLSLSNFQQILISPSQSRKV